jgi:hypothetical protein
MLLPTQASQQGQSSLSSAISTTESVKTSRKPQSAGAGDRINAIFTKLIWIVLSYVAGVAAMFLMAETLDHHRSPLFWLIGAALGIASLPGMVVGLFYVAVICGILFALSRAGAREFSLLRARA